MTWLRGRHLPVIDLLHPISRAMQIQPYSVAVDGSNNSGLEKRNPTTVRL